MTADDFRRMALALDGAEEAAHMGHPDFRVGGRVFATLGHPDGAWAMVQLPPEQQAVFVETAPDAFRPATGAWGARGSTSVRLDGADREMLERALRAAWLHVRAKAARRRRRA